MENAVRALEYAFAVLIFIIGLSASIYLLSEVKTTSDIVFSRVDTQRFYVDAEIPEDELTDNGNIKYNGRIVNIETIVPTLYRYYKENYIVEFYDLAGNNIIKFDLSQENDTDQIWTGDVTYGDAKKRLDIFLNGMGQEKTVKINSDPYDISEDIAFVKESDGSYVIDSSDKRAIEKNGLYNYCKDKKFSEEYAYVPEVSEQKIDEDITRVVIRYKEVQ